SRAFIARLLIVLSMLLLPMQSPLASHRLATGAAGPAAARNYPIARGELQGPRRFAAAKAVDGLAKRRAGRRDGGLLRPSRHQRPQSRLRHPPRPNLQRIQRGAVAPGPQDPPSLPRRSERTLQGLPKAVARQTLVLVDQGQPQSLGDDLARAY